MAAAAAAGSSEWLESQGLTPERIRWMSAEAVGAAQLLVSERERVLSRAIVHCSETFLPNGCDSSNIVFVVDTSGSTFDFFPSLQRGLCQAISALRIRAHFNVVAFGTEVVSVSQRLRQASQHHVATAIDWVGDLNVGGSTNTAEALKLALLSDPRTDTIVLLTDGQPDTPPREIMAQIAAADGDRGTVVHTRSLDCDNPLANQFLKELATSTGGTFLLRTQEELMADAAGAYTAVRPDDEIEELRTVTALLEQRAQALNGNNNNNNNNNKNNNVTAATTATASLSSGSVDATAAAAAAAATAAVVVVGTDNASTIERKTASLEDLAQLVTATSVLGTAATATAAAAAAAAASKSSPHPLSLILDAMDVADGESVDAAAASAAARAQEFAGMPVLVLHEERDTFRYLFRQGVIDRPATGDDFFVRFPSALAGGRGHLDVCSLVDMVSMVKDGAGCVAGDYVLARVAQGGAFFTPAIVAREPRTMRPHHAYGLTEDDMFHVRDWQGNRLYRMSRDLCPVNFSDYASAVDRLEGRTPLRRRHQPRDEVAKSRRSNNNKKERDAVDITGTVGIIADPSQPDTPMGRRHHEATAAAYGHKINDGGSSGGGGGGGGGGGDEHSRDTTKTISPDGPRTSRSTRTTPRKTTMMTKTHSRSSVSPSASPASAGRTRSRRTSTSSTGTTKTTPRKSKSKRTLTTKERREELNAHLEAVSAETQRPRYFGERPRTRAEIETQKDIDAERLAEEELAARKQIDVQRRMARSDSARASRQAKAAAKAEAELEARSNADNLNSPGGISSGTFASQESQMRINSRTHAQKQKYLSLERTKRRAQMARRKQELDRKAGLAQKVGARVAGLKEREQTRREQNQEAQITSERDERAAIEAKRAEMQEREAARLEHEHYVVEAVATAETQRRAAQAHRDSLLHHRATEAERRMEERREFRNKQTLDRRLAGSEGTQARAMAEHMRQQAVRAQYEKVKHDKKVRQAQSEADAIRAEKQAQYKASKAETEARHEATVSSPGNGARAAAHRERAAKEQARRSMQAEKQALREATRRQAHHDRAAREADRRDAAERKIAARLAHSQTIRAQNNENSITNATQHIVSEASKSDARRKQVAQREARHIKQQRDYERHRQQEELLRYRDAAQATGNFVAPGHQVRNREFMQL
eukprot:UC1_evm3s9